jgi:hypothetical protein
MWIDDRGSELLVYETQPADPFVKRMTWDPQRNCWVLFSPSTIARSLGDPVQKDAMDKFDSGEMSYAEMRALCG